MHMTVRRSTAAPSKDTPIIRSSSCSAAPRRSSFRPRKCNCKGKPMKFANFITYMPDPQKVQSVRPLHRDYAQGLASQGKIVIAGPFSDGAGAIIVYEAQSLEQAEALAANDPYAKGGVWMPVLASGTIPCGEWVRFVMLPIAKWFVICIGALIIGVWID